MRRAQHVQAKTFDIFFITMDWAKLPAIPRAPERTLDARDPPYTC